MQLGIFNEEAAKKAEKAGLTVVMDKCIMQSISVYQWPKSIKGSCCKVVYKQQI
jgi:predicted CoA-binding protein